MPMLDLQKVEDIQKKQAEGTLPVEISSEIEESSLHNKDSLVNETLTDSEGEEEALAAYE